MFCLNQGSLHDSNLSGAGMAFLGACTALSTVGLGPWLEIHVDFANTEITLLQNLIFISPLFSDLEVDEEKIIEKRLISRGSVFFSYPKAASYEFELADR